MSTFPGPAWIETELALAILDRQLAEHGGPLGLRDAAGLESALARPRNRWSYGETDPCSLAASYAYGVARNHPFVDGNKRINGVLARLFLALSNVAISFTQEDAVATVIRLAAGELSEEDLAEWFKSRRK